jgi:leucyl aminopeptidase (aminopeptidase T)
MAQAIPIGLAVAGTALSAGGSILSADSEAKEMRREATQLETQAGLERASSHRAAMEERRQARLAASRGLTVAAASGASVDDPTVVNILSRIEGEGEYRALSALYEGDQTALGMEAEAAAKRRGAKSTKTAGYIKAGSTILSAGSSMYDRYG